MAFLAPEVSPEPVRPPREQATASLETFGGGQGLEQINEQTQRIASSGSEIATFEKIRADQTAVEEAMAKLSAVHSDLLTNPDTGLPSYKGTDAMRGHDEVWSKYKKSANEIAQTLHGPTQVGPFTKQALVMGDALNQHAMAYATKEREQHAKDSFDSYQNNMANVGANSYGSYGNPNGPLALTYGNVKNSIGMRAKILGLDSDETKEFSRENLTNFHTAVLNQMANDPKFTQTAQQYFNDHKDEIDQKQWDKIQTNLDAIPNQREKETKHAQEEFYKANQKQALLDWADGKLPLSELQRRFRNGAYENSFFESMSKTLARPDAQIRDPMVYSDPGKFNEVRQAQLSGESPRAILDMITDGVAKKQIGMDDSKYLTNLTNEIPPSPRDKLIDAQAHSVRDFGNRYFAETNIFGSPTNKDKTDKEVEGLVSDYYKAVDKSKATGEQLAEIREHIIKTAMQKRFPGLGNLEKAPDVVIDVKNRVTRLLNPDEKSSLKPRYRITPVESQPSEEKP